MAHARSSEKRARMANEAKTAALAGILAAVVAVCCVLLLPYILMLIALIIWVPPNPDILESLRPTVRYLVDLHLWIPFMLWGGVSGVIAWWLGKDKRLYPALIACLLLLLFTNGWFAGLSVSLRHLGLDWRSDVLDFVGGTLWFLISALLILGMPKWRSSLGPVAVRLLGHEQSIRR